MEPIAMTGFRMEVVFCSLGDISLQFSCFGFLTWSMELSCSPGSNILVFGDRTVQTTPLSIKDQEEKARRCEFVHGMLLSTIFDDKL
ncbi:hypothetical protein CK203_078175 [Vitis vinifera]|uniref:Di19 C-terminal domain-containing protein n=1 Tax=Vitis vinifera TaxID=29760 RepID=A0A438DV47_VITVI|nr:hypothetical protein CK203_078175 [Vitis vinifera]